MILHTNIEKMYHKEKDKTRLHEKDNMHRSYLISS